MIERIEGESFFLTFANVGMKRRIKSMDKRFEMDLLIALRVKSQSSDAFFEFSFHSLGLKLPN
jgi:hypothetical protein